MSDSIVLNTNNGHSQQAVDRFNSIVKKYDDGEVLHILLTNYADNQDLEGFAEHLEDRLIENDLLNKPYKMKESNKLIAEFMGWDIKLPTTIPTNLHLSNLELDNKEIFDLKFHTHWDWLMPVVEEIHTHGCEVVISSNGVTTIYSSKGEVLAEEDSEADDHMHDATYKAVVTYIKEHFNKI